MRSSAQNVPEQLRGRTAHQQEPLAVGLPAFTAFDDAIRARRVDDAARRQTAAEMEAARQKAAAALGASIATLREWRRMQDMTIQALQSEVDQQLAILRGTG
ncbi:hypothetical protein ACFXKX_35680 [Streptomyces scopuliridis]|uniref:hypothetical protein n=1 Tax=Streptomyces scopuliridis TaxID=452529 RepID=UPI0036BA878B